MSEDKQPRNSAQQQTKRERFEQAGRFPVKKVAIAVVVVAVAVAGTLVGIKLYGDSTEVGGPVVSTGGVSYASTPVEMVLLTSPQVTGSGVITLSVAEVTSEMIGGFVYARSTPMPAGYDLIEGNGLPVLAYVSPSGRLVVATSMCEPCRSYDFHIEGKDLVCNTCFTRWDLDTLEGVAGGCLDYPPQEVNITVQGDVVQVQESELEAWVPRI